MIMNSKLLKNCMMDWWMQIFVFFNTASTFYSFMSNKNNTNLWSHEWILVWKCGQCPWHPVPDASLAQDCVTEGWSLQHPRTLREADGSCKNPWCFTGGCCISTTVTPPPQKKKKCGVGKGWVLGHVDGYKASFSSECLSLVTCRQQCEEVSLVKCLEAWMAP